jgi:cytochrome bd-type quinol oxidase subunit 1
MIPITVYDRFAMGLSLGVHIIFATIGILVYTDLVYGNKDINSSTVQCGAY